MDSVVAFYAEELQVAPSVHDQIIPHILLCERLPVVHNPALPFPAAGGKSIAASFANVVLRFRKRLSAFSPAPAVIYGTAKLLCHMVASFIFGDTPVISKWRVIIFAAPAWLNTFAEAEQLNVSKVLQDALTALYEKKNAAIA
jgi:toxin-antitoxin system, antitoxin component, hicB family